MTPATRPRAQPAGLAGALFVGVLLCAAFTAAVGIRVNVTIASLVPAFLALLLSRPLRSATWADFEVSDWSLAVFVVASAVSIALSLGHLGTLPPEFLLHAAALLVLCPLAYVIGRAVLANASAHALERVFHLALALAVGFVAMTFTIPDLVSTDESVRGSYYQYSGDGLAVAALVHLATRRAQAPRWPLLLVVPVLVLIGSRASVASYGAALLFSPLLPLVALAGAALVVVWMLLEDTLLSLVPGLFDASRVITSLLGAAIEGREDASLLEREQFQATAVASIGDHPLFGRFGYDYFANGFVGGFSHSALDLWAQYGLLSFAAFLGAIVLTPLLAQVRPGGAPARRTWPLLVFLLAELAFFRHPESVVLLFGIGALVGVAVRPPDATAPARPQRRLARRRARATP